MKPEAVLRELEQILSHSYFDKATLQANLLRQMVTWTVEGRSFDGHDLGYKLIPLYDKGTSSDVRKAKKFLLQWLISYYRSDGRENEVEIRLNTEGYGVTYAPNLSASFYSKLRLAQTYIEQYSPLRAVEALTLLASIDATEGHIEHLVLQSEIMLMLACFDAFTKVEQLHEHLYSTCRLVSNDEDTDWRSVGVKAAFQLCCGLVAASRKTFAQALEIDEESVQRFGWYWVFLITTGRIQEAVVLIETFCKEHPTDSFACAVLGMALYLVRDYDAALVHAEQAVTISSNCWFGHLVAGLAHHERKESEPAVYSYLQMQRALAFPGHETFCGLLIRFAANNPVQEKVATLYNEALETLRRPRQEEEPYNEVSITLAFAELVPQLALKCFTSRANSMTYPPWLWAHLWPILDPLRQNEEFRLFVELRRVGLGLGR